MGAKHLIRSLPMVISGASFTFGLNEVFKIFISSYEQSLSPRMINILWFFVELSDWSQVGKLSSTYVFFYKVINPISTFPQSNQSNFHISL